jgi:uncharacterized protein YndB with AHSA1/START domain
MTTPTTTPTDLVKKSIHVDAPPEVAFRVFTAEMTRWWPLANYHIGAADPREAVVEPFVGGRWFERGADGSECDWGRVLVWEPSARVVLTWEITAEWRHDSALHTEVEVRFSPEGRGTRVDLEHRQLDAYGPAAQAMKGVFDSEQGWSGLLAAFAAAVRTQG